MLFEDYLLLAIVSHVVFNSTWAEHDRQHPRRKQICARTVIFRWPGAGICRRGDKIAATMEQMQSITHT